MSLRLGIVVLTFVGVVALGAVRSPGARVARVHLELASRLLAPQKLHFSLLVSLVSDSH